MSLIPKSAAVRATIGLALGLMVGLAIGASSSQALRSFATTLEAIGTLWVNAIRMTVIPLVISLLIATIATEKDLGSVGRMGGRAIAIFVGLLSIGAVLGLAFAPPIMSSFQIDEGAAASLRAAASSGPPVHLPTFASWVAGLIPANPIKAAADGAMLPLIIFAVLFASALARTPPELRAAGTAFFRGVSDAMLVIVGWVLAVAPIGVFALAVTIAVRLGSAVVGAVGFYIALHCGLLVVEGLLYYLVARVGGGVSLPRFTRALLPAQVVAFSTRSSVAALPAMIDGAERVLGVPARIASFALPLGVTLLRANTGISWIVAAVFVAKLYGIHLTFAQCALFTVTSVAMSFSVPGVPSGGLLVITPFFLTIGLPVEGVGILIALDSIPDIFKTTINVTGQMTATVVLARMESVDPALQTAEAG